MLKYLLDRVVYGWNKLGEGSQFSLLLFGLGAALVVIGGTVLEFIWAWDLYVIVYAINILMICIGIILSVVGIGTWLESS